MRLELSADIPCFESSPEALDAVLDLGAPDDVEAAALDTREASVEDLIPQKKETATKMSLYLCRRRKLEAMKERLSGKSTIHLGSISSTLSGDLS